MCSSTATSTKAEALAQGSLLLISETWFGYFYYLLKLSMQTHTFPLIFIAKEISALLDCVYCPSHHLTS